MFVADHSVPRPTSHARGYPPPVSDRPRIVITRPISAEAVKLLESRADITVGPANPPIPTPEEVRELIKDADIVYTLPANPVNGEAIRGAKRLRLIATMGNGYDVIDIAAARERKIAVSYAPGLLDETTADGAFGLLIAAARRFGEAERYLRAGKYRGWTPFLFTGRDVHDATLGIVGMGRIGRALARRARGFKMKILYTDVRRIEDAERELQATYVTLDELLAQADFVSLNTPLLPETQHLINAERLRKMKRTAILINTSRGAVIDERALGEALRDGVIAGAGLDVFEREPSVDPLLFTLDNVVLLPHIASASEETRTRMAIRAAENVLAFMEGRALLDPVP